MRQFARPTPLERLSLEARIIYTVFAVFMLLGYGSSVWLYVDDELDLGAERARIYYLGEANTPAAPAATESNDGPDLDLPGDDGPDLDLDGLDAEADPAPPKTGMRFEKPARQVIETFHFHLFSMSVCYVIIAHLFMMGGLSRRTKVWFILGGGLATVVHVLVPVLIRFVSPAFAGLMGASALLLGITWLVMTVHPVWEMWRLPLPAKKS